MRKHMKNDTGEKEFGVCANGIGLAIDESIYKQCLLSRCLCDVLSLSKCEDDGKRESTTSSIK